MKLKFKAEGKDILIFALFCIGSLYLVAVGVGNIATFANTGKFLGFSPMLGFSKNYWVTTLVFWIFAMAFIIVSVKSLFFEREKGVGFEVGAKNEKGYARWATNSEMKKELKKVYALDNTSKYAGIPLMNNGKTIWVDDGEYHNLIIGSTGSGKTEMLVQPLVKVLAKKGESMIVTDPKGEIYEKNANMLKEKGYNVVILNFRDTQKGSAWNPLYLPYQLYKSGNKDKANELLDDLAANILYDEKAQNQDPFWEKTSADYFVALALSLFEDAKEEEINLNSINLMSTIGDEKFNGTTYIKDYFSYKNPSSPAYINAVSTLMAPNDTKNSILSVFKQKIKLFSARENLAEMLAHNDLDLKDIGRKKTALFIVIQDEKKTYHSLVTILIKQIYETLIDVAQESGGKLAYRTNFILDEFANMPPLKDVTTMVTAARSRKMRFNFIIQNIAQLHQVYGKDNGETIKGNCGNIIYLISSEIAALEEISKMCGEIKEKDKDGKTTTRPLITVSDLQRLKMYTMILVRIRTMPFKTVLEPDWRMNKNQCWGKPYELADYPRRERAPVQMFDIKAFCKSKQEQKMNELMNKNEPATTGGLFEQPAKGNLDVDNIIKRIDAKIAEIEAQEKAEAKPQDKPDTKKIDEPKIDAKSINKGGSVPETTPIIENIEQKAEKPIVEHKVEPVIPKPVIEQKPVIEKKPEIVSEPKKEVVEAEIEYKPKKIPTNEITDDQFFDDFFSDED